MGNCKSCIKAEPKTATLIDCHGRLRQIKVPIMAAEIMLDEPGHVISPELLIRRTRRLTAMKADEELFPGKIYLLVPAARANSRVSGSEMELVDYACEKNRGAKRRRCKALPTATGVTGDRVNCFATSSLGDGTGFADNRVSYSCPRRAVLEPIFEESGSFRVELPC